jgi:hypothetical protein
MCIPSDVSRGACMCAPRHASFFVRKRMENVESARLQREAALTRSANLRGFDFIHMHHRIWISHSDCMEVVYRQGMRFHVAPAIPFAISRQAFFATTIFQCTIMCFQNAGFARGKYQFKLFSCCGIHTRL